MHPGTQGAEDSQTANVSRLPVWVRAVWRLHSSWEWIRAEPAKHLICALVRWEHGIEHVLNSAVTHNQRQSLQQSHTGRFECRQAQRVCELELAVAKDLEWKLKPFGHFALILCRLGAQAE